MQERSRRAPLQVDRETFREIGHRLVDQIATFIESQPARPVTHDESPEAVRQAFDLTATLPEEGVDAKALVEDTARLLFDHSLLNGHPKFFGYITSSPAPIGMLGDLLAAAINPNLAAWVLSPAATEIEAQTIRWIAEFIGYPEECGGILVSGGNMANTVCFYAARAAMARYDVREQGVNATGGRLRVYASAETHTWIQKAADMAGLGTAAIRWIPTDAHQRMDVARLRTAIQADVANGDMPCMVVGTAGSVSTGAIDPLPELAAICKEYGAWFHVDGAYGGLAARHPDAPAELRGLELADSVAVDPHKWLYAPLEAGCALVRDAQKLRDAFAYHPRYYHFGSEVLNYLDYGPQNSRGFRALKVWLALKQAGAAGYRTMIGDDLRLSRAMAAAVERHPDLELVTQSLSITTFRFLPADLRAAGAEAADAINRALLDRLQRGGELFVSHAIVDGRFALRACIVNFYTSDEDVAEVPEIVARVGWEVQRDLGRTPVPAPS